MNKKDKKKYFRDLQNHNTKQKGQNQKKGGQKKKEEVEYDFDQCDFPLPYSHKRLIEGWFDFNDSTVTPILPGKLQS